MLDGPIAQRNNFKHSHCIRIQCKGRFIQISKDIRINVRAYGQSLYENNSNLI